MTTTEVTGPVFMEFSLTCLNLNKPTSPAEAVEEPQHITPNFIVSVTISTAPHAAPARLVAGRVQR